MRWRTTFFFPMINCNVIFSNTKQVLVITWCRNLPCFYNPVLSHLTDDNRFCLLSTCESTGLSFTGFKWKQRVTSKTRVEVETKSDSMKFKSSEEHFSRGGSWRSCRGWSWLVTPQANCFTVFIAFKPITYSQGKENEPESAGTFSLNDKTRDIILDYDDLSESSSTRKLISHAHDLCQL